MERIHFGNIYANNFDSFWNNSTKLGDILDMSKKHFTTKF